MGAMNELLGAAAIDQLATSLGDASPPGAEWKRVRAVVQSIEPLAIRGRSDAIARAIVDDMTAAFALDDATARYRRFAGIVREATSSPRFTGWLIWPVTEAVVSLALAAVDDSRDASTDAGLADGSPPPVFDDALDVLALLTPALSAEFAIRRMLAHDLDRAMARITPWARHPNEHVRRLASEGTRSYLPWAIRVPSLIAHPEATIPILDALRDDPSEYVRRSVANHLNDLARHEPGLVVSIAGRWQAQSPSVGTRGVIRHGLRSLVKKADPGALALLGFAPVPVTVSAIRLDRDALELPDHLEFSVDVTNDSTAVDARLAVDYVIHYRKANGSLAAKVFKLAIVDLAPGETRTATRRHAFRQMTTRVHHPGTHAIEIQVNGVRSGRVEFSVAT